ncbi:hypothetical protein Mmc1_0532 [Magnetococcus marinus MC-1]|uniref:Uncharacterized protein n=1 Tax=Magnetococcus marinus (strain ATCC BAA-1437 / JCM 17883 / MC-1) TaxID=156889 RepID=A0L514_MAGMM|nr:hypothetical protein [Magnetococcus marinus]ABK43057.1 hypothetical protein Mmc1_0532 [Magnetococcus marinus MC-1]
MQRTLILALLALLLCNHAGAEDLWDPEKAVLVQRLQLSQDNAELTGKVYLHTLSPLKVELKIAHFKGHMESVIKLVSTWTRKQSGLEMWRQLGVTTINNGSLRVNGTQWAELTAEQVQFQQGEINQLSVVAQGDRWRGSFEQLRLTDNVGRMRLPQGVFPLQLTQLQGSGTPSHADITILAAQIPQLALQPVHLKASHADQRVMFVVNSRGGALFSQPLWQLVRDHPPLSKRLLAQEQHLGIRSLTLAQGTLKLGKTELRGMWPPSGPKNPLKGWRGDAQLSMEEGLLSWVGAEHLPLPFKGQQQATLHAMLARIGISDGQLLLQQGSGVVRLFDGEVKLKSIRPATLYPSDSDTLGFRADLEGVHLSPWRWQGHLTRTGAGGMPYSLSATDQGSGRLESAGMVLPLWGKKQVGLSIDAAYLTLRDNQAPFVIESAPLPLKVEIKRLGCGQQRGTSTVQWQSGQKPLKLCQPQP